MWHERLLFFQYDAQHWVVQTPDGDMYTENVMCETPESGPCRAVVLPASGELPVFLKGRTYRVTKYPDDKKLLTLIEETRQLAVSEGFDGPGPTLYFDALGERRPLDLKGAGMRRHRQKGPPAPTGRDAARVTLDADEGLPPLAPPREPDGAPCC